MPHFATDFISLAAKRSPLCVGVDPSAELLKEWGLTCDAQGVADFCDLILEAAADQVAIFKPQSAFFERFGPAGMSELVRLGRKVRAQGSFFVIDCKRGDMGPSQVAYADAFLGPESPFYADAITVAPYLGFASISPILHKAVAVGAGVFIVVRSSNREGSVLQDARLDDGLTVADSLAEQITRFNELQGPGLGSIGAVMGATLGERAAKTLSLLPTSLFLAPGVGAQGATISDIARDFGSAASRTLPSVSRGILGQGPSVSKLREIIQKYREEAFSLL